MFADDVMFNCSSELIVLNISETFTSPPVMSPTKTPDGEIFIESDLILPLKFPEISNS